MGTFEVPLQVGNITGQQLVEVRALVDTGSTYTAVPSSILTALGIEVMETHPFELADDRIVEYGIGEARVRLDGQEWPVVVVFAPDGSQPRLGMTTLGVFNLAVDPSSQRLVPALPLLKIPLRKAG